MAEYRTLDDIYEMLAENRDITIQIPADQIDVVRKAMSKRKHKEKKAFGELADQDSIFTATPIKQTEEEKAKGVARLRMYIEQKHKVAIFNAQVNDEDF